MKIYGSIVIALFFCYSAGCGHQQWFRAPESKHQVPIPEWQQRQDLEWYGDSACHTVTQAYRKWVQSPEIYALITYTCFRNNYWNIFQQILGEQHTIMECISFVQHSTPKLAFEQTKGFCASLSITNWQCRNHWQRQDITWGHQQGVQCPECDREEDQLLSFLWTCYLPTCTCPTGSGITGHASISWLYSNTTQTGVGMHYLRVMLTAHSSRLMNTSNLTWVRWNACRSKLCRKNQTTAVIRKWNCPRVSPILRFQRNTTCANSLSNAESCWRRLVAWHICQMMQGH